MSDTTFIVKLYKEGDPCDGDEFACGPYLDEELAERAAVALAGLGSPSVLPLYDSADQIIETLGDPS